MNVEAHVVSIPSKRDRITCNQQIGSHETSRNCKGTSQHNAFMLRHFNTECDTTQLEKGLTTILQLCDQSVLEEDVRLLVVCHVGHPQIARVEPWRSNADISLGSTH